MLLRVPNALSPEVLAECRKLIADADWQDGKMTAGTQSGQVKNNRQLPEDSPAAVTARELILAELAQNALFISAVLPKRIFPPLFNRYDGDTNTFGNHVDNAVRTSRTTGEVVRTDVSVTVFLSDPEAYDGGELVVEDSFGVQRIKLPAGDMILYPSSSIHRVEPVTHGTRLASFFWVESMVRPDEQRRLLFDMDLAIVNLRQTEGDSPAVVKLTGCYHNLLRMWADT
ncbi:MAG: Fe2+-dependent dioxygenase [Vampirovibrio sp.]|jgi:PKHD-type hydroxylase|nr:Fe2+-dependent dioxygenase [Vampirovibrio sp.]